MKATQKQVQKIVDDLGMVRAQLATLREQETALELQLYGMGKGSYDGIMFHSTVSIWEQVATSWKAIAEKLQPSRQLIAAHSSTIIKRKICVTARLTDKKAA